MNNEQIAHQTVKSLLEMGVQEVCVCPGKRNAPLVFALRGASQIKLYSWPEERSAAFFALGRARLTALPVAVVVTSGTAAGELLPAAMEAHYTSTPLILITADRPPHFRGTGAPQSAEQEGLYGVYAQTRIADWKGRGPLHLNISFDEPATWSAPYTERIERTQFPAPLLMHDPAPYLSFLKKSHYPLVIVSNFRGGDDLVSFLLHLNAPVYVEGTSQLREDERLQSLLIPSLDGAWKRAEAAGYPIDAVLRIGGVPTVRLWRDLEEGTNIAVLSVTEVPFSGSTKGEMIHTSIFDFCRFALHISPSHYPFHKWKEEEKRREEELQILWDIYPLAEPSCIHHLSCVIPRHAHVYLGNSLPIREWDQAASRKPNQRWITASRGLNGIDGQIATFLGLSTKERPNWGIFGDLTALYDLVGPWILPQLTGMNIQLVVVNNGGGMIFDRFFQDEIFLHSHGLSFEPLAKLWNLPYEKWEAKEVFLPASSSRLIEVVPDPIQTKEFANAYASRLSRAAV